MEDAQVDNQKEVHSVLDANESSQPFILYLFCAHFIYIYDVIFWENTSSGSKDKHD